MLNLCTRASARSSSLGLAGLAFFIPFIALANNGSSALTRIGRDECWIKTIAPPDAPGQEPTRRLKQLTASPCAPTTADISDPSPPYDDGHGTLSVSGSGITRWTGKSSSDAWKSFLRGETPVWKEAKFFYANGVQLLPSTYGEEAWDVTIEHFDSLAEPVAYAGVMKPRAGSEHASFPGENASRRTRSFHLVNGRWTMDVASIFTEFGEYDWLGHNYGHSFIKDDDGKLWMFYERVSQIVGGSPFKTEIFARRFTPPTTLTGPEVPIYKIPARPFPAMTRENGNLLVEGPRPFVVNLNGQRFYMISFSSSDWASNHYGINLMWSRKIDGPYQPYLNANGSDLTDFSGALRTRHGLTFGPGRASFFQDPAGRWWTIFHAARVADPSQPDPSSFGPLQRNYFLAPVRIDLANGQPRVEILEQE